jgi:hypothetical protein
MKLENVTVRCHTFGGVPQHVLAALKAYTPASEIVALKGKCGSYGKNLINPLVATQNFGCKMSNIVDKPL